MGNSWFRSLLRRQRLCLRLRGADPAFHLFAGVAQRQEHSVVSREGAGSSPVVRASVSWWLWCNGSIRGRDPRGTGSNPVGRPLKSHADAGHSGELPAL